MTAIQSARKRILHGIPFGNVRPYQGSACSFLVLLIRFYEGVRLTHQTSESGTKLPVEIDPKRTFARLARGSEANGAEAPNFRRPSKISED